MTRRRLWFLAIIGVLLFLGGIIVAPAFAHAVPVRSTPATNAILDASPAEVTIQFNEPVVPELSQITVLTQAGQAVDVGTLQAADAENRTLAISLPSLSDGAYLVSWQVLSAVDGHTTSGTFSFGIGNATLTAVSEEVTVTAQLSPLSAAARWLTLTGISLLMGLFAFRLFVWNPVLADVELEAEEEALDQTLAQIGLNVGRIGLAVIGVALVLIFFDQAATSNLFQLSNFRTWLGTQFGAVWVVRVLLTAVLHFHLTLFVDVRGGRQDLRGWEWWAGLALAVGVALTSALISHSAALTENVTQAVLIDWLHVLAASIWVGGLLFFALVVWHSRHLKSDNRSWLTLSLILNFSAIAAMAVGALTASGVYLAARHVGSWTSLVSTAYGLALLAKLTIALIVFGIAGVNLTIIKPRLNAAYNDEDTVKSDRLVARFSRFVRIEAGLALLLLVAAGILTDLQRGVDAPALSDEPGRTVVTQSADDLDVELAIEPALVGQNTFDITITDENGDLVTDAEDVSIRYTFLGQSLGAETAAAEQLDNGRYRVAGSYISLFGTWQLEVSIRRPGAYDTFAPFRLEAGVGGDIRSVDSGVRPLESAAKFLTLAGGGGTGALLILAAVVWGIIATRAARTEWQLIPLLSVSLLAFWLGSAQLVTFFNEDFTPAKFTTNPILPDVESIAIGQQLYEENCVSCHGPEGHGDGPTAQTLNPPPADFAAGHTATHPDGDLYFWILEGIEDTPMPAFGDQITEEEAWHLVNYVRRLSANQSAAGPSTQ